MLPCFNGATLIREWKDLHGRLICVFCLALQWGHSHSRVERPGRPGRRSAPVRLQWGHSHSRVERDVRVVKSAPPTLLQWGHSHSRVESTVPPANPTPAQCFNGATLIREWKVGCRFKKRTAAIASMGPLSFESGKVSDVGGHAHGDRASMGPLSFESGKGGDQFRHLVRFLRLQWGHSHSRVESSSKVGPSIGRETGFNGATLIREWKEHTR